MAQRRPLEIYKKPLAQVGAVLFLDTEIAEPDYRGGKHWKHNGSCVLMSPRHILTVGHTLGARSDRIQDGRHAVFFPYVGLLRIIDGPDWEYQALGDNLALATLGESVDRWPAVRPSEVDGSFKYDGKARVCGFGAWRDWRGLPFGTLEGLQQQYLLRMGPPEEYKGWLHYDNLDLCWSASFNGGLTAGRGNSGGPFLVERDDKSFDVVAISREALNDQQIGSWIAWRRFKWLEGKFPENGPGPVPPIAEETPFETLKLTSDEGQVARFNVPSGKRKVRATLNASPGLRLQMGIVPGAVRRRDLLPGLANNNEASGRFLCRTCELPEGTQSITVGVCRVARSPFKAGQEVMAQLCVLFE